jgi:hypothetical protein
MTWSAARSLEEGAESEGEHTVSWNAAAMASGVYLCRMEARSASGGGARFSATTKLVLLR